MGVYPLQSSINRLLFSALCMWGGGCVAGCGSSEETADKTAATGGTSSMAGGGSGSGADDSGTAASPLAYNPCPRGSTVGNFSVQLATDYTGVSGTVRNGVVPRDVPEQVAEAGSCQLLTQTNLFCDPPCGATKTCSTDGTCIDYPKNQNAGVVTISGLKTELNIEPSASNFYTNPAQPKLPHPGFDEGAAIELRASGGDLEPFVLHGAGVQALTLTEGELLVSGDQALELNWDASDALEAAHLLFKIEFNRHGGTPTWVECDVPDTGSFSVPQDILQQLFALEISGWPTLTSTRRTADSTVIAGGCVEFQVMSQVVSDLQVAGVVSCDDSHPCPGAAECQANLTCPE